MGDLGLVKKIVKTIDLTTTISGITTATADHTPHSFESSLIDQIILIDLDLHVSDREIGISKKKSSQEV